MRLPCLIVVLTMLVVSGCTFGGLLTISEPHSPPESPSRLARDGIVRLERISVSVTPDNQVLKVLTMGVILPIIPVGFSWTPSRDGQPFRVQVRFETESSEFILDPSEILLGIRGETFRATRVTPFIDSRTTTWDSEHLPGHSFECVSTTERAEDFQPVVDRPAIKLATGCVNVEFAVKTPHPREPYSVHVKGLRYGERAVDIEPIHFRPGTRGGVQVYSNR